jgi:hypothetical protein
MAQSFPTVNRPSGSECGIFCHWPMLSCVKSIVHTIGPAWASPAACAPHSGSRFFGFFAAWPALLRDTAGHPFVIYLPVHRTVFFLFSSQQNMQSPISEARSLAASSFIRDRNARSSRCRRSYRTLPRAIPTTHKRAARIAFLLRKRHALPPASPVGLPLF